MIPNAILHQISVTGTIMPIKEELPLTNPQNRVYDDKGLWFIKLKLFIKKYISPSPFYNEIIPRTDNHPTWILGVQPDESTIRELAGKYKCSEIQIVSLIVKREQILEGKTVGDQEQLAVDGTTATFNRLTWFDHTALDVTTGKNQTVESMERFQEKLGESFKDTQSIFYCHCMAGRSRSFAETLAFLYQNPQVFDFELKDFVINGTYNQKVDENNPWKKVFDAIYDEKGGQYTIDLMERLKNNRSFSDIAEFVELCRPKVKPFKKLDGDQAGLIGLLALSKAANGIREPHAGQEDSEYKKRLYTDARDIGLMLRAPLDKAFRDQRDLEKQLEDLTTTFGKYQKKGVNLLAAMIIPKNSEAAAEFESFKKHFAQLKPSEQARFAILLRKLEQHTPELDLSFLKNKSLELAQIAAEKSKKLTSGDQIELLRSFGDSNLTTITYSGVINKILYGSDSFWKKLGFFFLAPFTKRGELDKYNQGIQLAELHKIAKDQHPEVTVIITSSVKKLNMTVQNSYDSQLKKNSSSNPSLTIEEPDNNSQMLTSTHQAIVSGLKIENLSPRNENARQTKEAAPNPSNQDTPAATITPTF